MSLGETGMDLADWIGAAVARPKKIIAERMWKRET